MFLGGKRCVVWPQCIQTFVYYQLRSHNCEIHMSSNTKAHLRPSLRNIATRVDLRVLTSDCDSPGNRTIGANTYNAPSTHTRAYTHTKQQQHKTKTKEQKDKDNEQEHCAGASSCTSHGTTTAHKRRFSQRTPTPKLLITWHVTTMPCRQGGTNSAN